MYFENPSQQFCAEKSMKFMKFVQTKCHLKFWMKTIINRITYLLLEPKPSVCSPTNLPLLLKKPPRDLGAAILLLLPGLVIHLQQPRMASRLLLFTKCRSSDQERSSSMSCKWEAEALLVFFYRHFCFCTKMKFYRICWEILKWWELDQIHSQQTIPLCPPCRSSTSLFSSRCWCQCAPPPPSQKNLFTDVGAGLLVHVLVPVSHLQQEAMRWL